MRNIGKKKIAVETPAQRSERFWSLVAPGKKGCQLWEGPKGQGKGIFHWFEAWGLGDNVRRVSQTASRFAYEDKKARLATFYDAPCENLRPTCGNPLCVNPEHQVLEPIHGRFPAEQER